MSEPDSIDATTAPTPSVEELAGSEPYTAQAVAAEVDAAIAAHVAGYRDLAHLRIEADSDRTDWPEEWKRHERKSFPRFEPSSMPLPGGSAAVSRRSVRTFRRHDISHTELGGVLEPCRLFPNDDRPEPTRAAPSAGGLFPIEIYAIPTSGHLAGRVYYYDAEKHAAVPTVKVERTVLADPCDALGMSRCQNPSLLLFFTAVMYRNMRKYAARGYRYALLEAGAIAQTVESNLNSGGLSAVWLGGFDDLVVAETLGLRSELDMEYPILAMAIGRTT